MTSVAPLALDTNILVLYTVGLVDKGIISRHRRLQKYESDDFDLLVKILALHDKFIVTPGILAECSDLLRYDRPSAQRTCAMLNWILSAPDVLFEKYYPTANAAKRPESAWLGLVDAGLFDVVDDGIPLITDDFDLFVQVKYRNQHCINFDEYRLNR